MSVLPRRCSIQYSLDYRVDLRALFCKNGCHQVNITDNGSGPKEDAVLTLDFFDPLYEAALLDILCKISVWKREHVLLLRRVNTIKSDNATVERCHYCLRECCSEIPENM